MAQQIVLTNKAVLMSLNIGHWAANAKDTEVSKEVATSKKLANSKMARVWKSLIEKNPYYDAIISAEKKARRFHAINTFAWVQDGSRILPTANFGPYNEFMRATKAEWEKAVEAFILHFPEIQEAAKTALNSIYRDQDYPSAKALRAKFHFSTLCTPLPSGAMFEADIDPAEADRIRADIESQVQKVFKAANTELWERLYTQIHKIQEQLTSPKGIREQSVKSVREMLSLLDRLNVTGDARLEKLRAEAEARLGVLSANDLNKDKVARATLVADTARIGSAMADFMGAPAHVN